MIKWIKKIFDKTPISWKEAKAGKKSKIKIVNKQIVKIVNMKISNHLTLAEVVKSNTADRYGIDNTPTNEHLENLKLIAEKVFEPLRVYIKNPLGISSGYRSFELNKAVKGSKTSQHCKGEALDIDADIFGGTTNSEIFNYIKDNLDFDQLIWEYGNNSEPNWVHVSYSGFKNRKIVLKAIRGKGYMKY